MSGYLLDTNIISDLIRNPDGLATHRIEQVGAKEIFTSIIVASELRYGHAKKGSPKLLTKVESIRAELEAAGQPIGMNDLLIAAHAHALGLTPVTDNTRKFSRIRGLNIENWLER